MKSKTLLISAIYAVVTWILALLNIFNPGGNETYSLIVFSAFGLLGAFGTIVMTLVVIVSCIVTLVKAGKADADKSVIKPCIIYSVISIALIHTVSFAFNIMGKNFF